MLPNGHLRVALRLASALLIVATVLIFFSAAAHASCTSPANSIEAENCLPGTPQSQWDVIGAGDPSIQGFATDISVNAGGTISFKVNTVATQYHIDIYRMGYYQGNGARLIVGKALSNAITPSVTLPQTQPACVTDSTTNLVDCGNWAVSASWAVPSTAVSGIYFAQLVRDDTVGTSHIVFVVRNDSSNSPILFQTSDETWQAYNDYGGHSLYGPTGVFNNSQRAYKVSYNRPFHTRSFDPASWVFYAEYPMVRWLEANGYNVTYFTSVDAARSGNSILNHKLYMTAGHDEYWSGPKRTSIEAARSAGVHLAFMTGTGAFWKSRWENSIDGSNTAYRTLVSYKETLGEAKIDPLDPPTWTGTWRDTTFSPPADGGRPENALTGTLFAVNGCGTDNTDLSIQVPAADGKMRFWRNTTIGGQTTGQVFTLPAGTLGYAWDIDADNGSRPAGLFRLSTGTYNLTTDYLIDFGETYASGTATHHSTLYKASSKALVFGAGTVQWSWGLDNHHDTYCSSGPYNTDANMQQATVNLLADMGIQPATLQAGLLTASASSDTTPPSSTITSPASGAKVEPGATITISGTAADTGGGVVGGVEVSTDGGTTWHPAVGRESWSYVWTLTGSGSINLRSRAVDDSGNIESPSAGVTVNVSAPSCPCTIWPSTTTPGTIDSGDPNPYELGVKFTADFDGTITGIRFYKSPANVGTHIGNLWSAGGTLLGTGTFTNESASGWQEMDFTSPVAITANTVYVASYSTTTGEYSFDANYFTNSGVDNPPLHALQNGVSGGNGVLATTPGVFPSSTFSNANYWVDLVYVPTSTKTLVSITVAPTNPTLQIGHTQSFTATGIYSDGSTADVTSQVSWSSSNTSVATVNAGIATGVAGGAANVIATLGLASGYTTVTVQSAPLAITTTAISGGAVNVPYSAILGATGGVAPYTWSLAAGISLPPGLSLSPSGLISGTPLVAATSTFTVQVKDSGVPEANVNPQQTATKAVSITVTIPASFTIWPAAAAPVTPDAGDPSAVELGVSFKADTGGVITGIRFYKSAANTGAHIGNLWTSTGTLLASATFTGETASGWQQVTFATPVAIAANTVYVASYHTTVGHYAADANTFTTAGVDNPPLHAVQNTATTPNGVFTYDITTGCNVAVKPCFPTTSFNSANYWVDVAFQNTFGLSGTISGGGGPGTTLTVSTGGVTVATVTANASGAYSVAGLGDGTYLVVPTNPGFTFVPPSHTVTMSNGNATANFTTAFSISGTIAGAGGNRATVTLSGAASATTTADASGHFAFPDLANGAYTVTVAHTGFTFTPASQAVTLNNTNGTASFSTLFSLSGNISPAASGAGATVALTGTSTASTIADSNGNFSFAGLPSGTYTVTAAKPGFGFSPSSQVATSNGTPVFGVNFTAAAAITIDATATKDSGSAKTSIASATFSTVASNELLLAFIATDGNSANLTVTSVTGAGLTWTLVQRTNAQLGTAEIWRAFAPSTLSKVSVTATLSQSVAASITVVSFAGVNTSGTNGSGAIGATGTASATTGAPTASLVTTQNNSWVFGVGNDYAKATARTLGPNQTMVHQYLATSAASTMWVQSQSAVTPVSGTTVTINDTAPTNDHYNLSLCEILPVPPPAPLGTTLQYVATDTTTQGNWKTAYGADGYNVIGDTTAYPAYAAVTPAGQTPYTWTASTTDVRALEQASATSRLAATWYANSSFTVDVNLTDGQLHKVAMYFLDWSGSTPRAETVTVVDADTAAVLDTRNLASFGGGQYLVYNVSGHVTFQVTRTAGANAVVSGIFFGGPFPPTSTVQFVATDTTTQGNWAAAYGADGYNVIGDTTSYPTYATVMPTGQTAYTWSASTTDVRALERASGAGRLAAAWYANSSFSVDINLTDGQLHQIALYCLDWSSTQRAERIDILDATTNTLMDTRTVTSFNGGQYLIWNVSGHVTVKVTLTAGANAVVSGIFFGSSRPPSSTAQFVEADATTQGNWQTAYGIEGYNVFGDTTSYPTYATVTPTGQTAYTWAASTNDVRALEKSNLSGRVAGVWYANTSFLVDVNLTDGNTHQIALYLLDWDSTTRTERIDILDTATGTVLDSRNVTGFHGGLYMVWNVSGHITVKITKIGGANAVVSGVFFGG